MRYFIILLSFFICGFTCTPTKKLSNQNMAGIYRKELQALLPEVSVYHLSTDVTQLHFKIKAKELLYTRGFGETDFRCNVSVSGVLKYSYESTEVLDSTSVRITDTNPENTSNKEFIGVLNIRARAWDNFLLEVTVSDLNRNAYSITYVRINKYDNVNAQNFFVTYADDQLPAFQQHVELNKKLNIEYTEPHKTKLFVRYYNRNFPIAAPPFSIDPPKPFEYRADSTFTISTNDSGRFVFTCAKTGFYHIQVDTAKKEGLSLFSFYPNFPEINSTDQLIGPLRYLMSKQEFDAMITSSNKKAAIEEFWVKVGGSQDRAKELIKKYYTRVKDANMFFTSYLEGWKSDRGMIYIVHGPPNAIYKTSNSESWVYGEENNLMSVTYTFVKVKNPFSDNDYILERQNEYKNGWFRAVDIWRQGRVYVDN
jgi:GWxTD domain-containing protein